MEQMKMVGVNNILINPVIPDKTTSTTEGEKQQRNFHVGSICLIVEAIKQTLHPSKNKS